MAAFNSPSLLLIKDSGITGLVGLAFMGSLALPRPLMFYFGRKFATNGSKDAVAYWNNLWQYGGFRHTQRVLTVTWGLGFLAEAVLRIIVVLAGVLPVKTLLLFSNIFPYVVLCALMAFTFWYSMHSQRKSAAAMAAAAELNRLSQAR
jgi:amino acid transporter